MKQTIPSLRLKRNVMRYYLLCFCSELYLPLSVWLFYYLRFFDFTQVAVLVSVQIIAAIIFEIPTGALADVIGRKRVTIASFTVYAIGLLIQGTSGIFSLFLVAEILKGLGNALYSGSMEALLYDTLKEEGQEKQYKKIIANAESIIWIAYFIGAIAGGFLFHYWFRGPYLLTVGVYVIGIIIALRLYEPKLDSVKYTLTTYIKQNITGFQELFNNRAVSHISIVLITVAALYYIAANILGISQAREYGMDSRGVGVLFAIGYLIAAAFSQLYPRIHERFGDTTLLIAVTIILISTFIFAPYTGIAVGSLLIIVRIASSTTFNNIKSNMIQPFITSQNRATALSTLSLIAKLPYALGAYTIGAFIESSSPNTFALGLGIAGAVLLCSQLIMFRLFAARHS